MSTRQQKSQCAPATKAELAWIKRFKALCKKAPKTLWLFSASGTLLVMKNPPDGNHMGSGTRGEGVNQDNAIDTVDIRNDGGDW